MSKEIDKQGTDGNDHIVPKGRGTVYAGKGEDIVVLSEGDYFNIEGFQDFDNGMLSISTLEKANSAREILGQAVLEIKTDRLLMYIEPEKEEVQEVQYFVQGGSTYVQVYDKDSEKIVSAARVNGTDFKIEVIGENGNIGVTPILIDSDQSSARDIRELIAKKDLKGDPSFLNIVSDYIENAKDEARSLPLIGNLLDRSTSVTPTK